MKSFLLFALLQISLAEYHSDSPCPSRPVQQNFEITKITGRWYTVLKYEDTYGSSLTCGYGTYTSIDNKSVKVVDCELSGDKYSCLTGIISVNDTSTFPFEGKTLYAYFDNPAQNVDSFKYLSTDYDNYAIVYECKEMPEEKSVHYLWVSSRTPVMSTNTKATVDAFIEKYFDKSEIKVIEQDGNICGFRA